MMLLPAETSYTNKHMHLCLDVVQFNIDNPELPQVSTRQTAMCKSYRCIARIIHFDTISA